jgi:hypothetical protein
MPPSAQPSDVPGDIGIGDGGGEVVSVDKSVVVSTDERHIGEGSLSAVDPMSDVMGVAPMWGSSAVGKSAAFVSNP